MLFSACRKLQRGQSDCLFPHNWLIRELVTSHFSRPSSFDWQSVDVRGREYERAIQTYELSFDEALKIEQWAAQSEAQKKYKQTFAALRPELQALFALHGEPPTTKFRDAIRRAEAGNPNLLIAIGTDLYSKAVKSAVGEAIVHSFIQACPPFKALLYSILMTWFHESVRDPATGESFGAQRNDLFMSAHLPYCDFFVTAEKNRVQERCLREIAAIANLMTAILSYEEFSQRLLLIT